MVIRLDRSVQNSTVIAELDGSRRTRRFLQNSTVLAELDQSRKTQRFQQNSITNYRSQNSTVLAELDGSRRTRRFSQNSSVLAELGGSLSQNSTVLAELDMFCRFITLLFATAPHTSSYARNVCVFRLRVISFSNCVFVLVVITLVVKVALMWR